MAGDPFTSPLIFPQLGFTGSPLDRSDELRRHPDLLQQLRTDPAARFVAFSDLRPIVDLSSGTATLLWLDNAAIPAGTEAVFLGRRDGRAFFAVSAPADTPLPGEPIEMRAAAAQLPYSDGAILAQARSLLDWH